MKQDYWFEPGDKVMRVLNKREADAIARYPVETRTVAGSVYCVTRCWRHSYGYNVMSLAGFPQRDEFYCFAFRKVEEIKLCVKAAQKVGEPVEVEPEFSQAPENTL